jgi:hypothetical protein
VSWLLRSLVENEWHFLNFTHPLQTRSLQTRKRVRSLVTKKLHSQGRLVAFAKVAVATCDYDPQVMTRQASARNNLDLHESRMLHSEASQLYAEDCLTPVSSSRTSPLTRSCRMHTYKSVSVKWDHSGSVEHLTIIKGRRHTRLESHADSCQDRLFRRIAAEMADIVRAEAVDSFWGRLVPAGWPTISPASNDWIV